MTLLCFSNAVMDIGEVDTTFHFNCNDISIFTFAEFFANNNIRIRGKLN